MGNKIPDENIIPQVVCPHCGEVSFQIAVTEEELQSILYRRIKDEHNKLVYKEPPTSEEILTDALEKSREETEKEEAEIELNNKNQLLWEEFQKSKPEQQLARIYAEADCKVSDVVQCKIDGMWFRKVKRTIFEYAGKEIGMYDIKFEQEHSAAGMDVNMYKETMLSIFDNNDVKNVHVKAVQMVPDVIGMYMNVLYMEEEAYGYSV